MFAEQANNYHAFYDMDEVPENSSNLLVFLSIGWVNFLGRLVPGGRGHDALYLDGRLG